MTYSAAVPTLELSIMVPPLMYNFIIVPNLESTVAFGVLTTTCATPFGRIVGFNLSDFRIMLRGFLCTPITDFTGLTLF